MPIFFEKTFPNLYYQCGFFFFSLYKREIIPSEGANVEIQLWDPLSTEIANQVIAVSGSPGPGQGVLSGVDKIRRSLTYARFLSKVEGQK